MYNSSFKNLSDVDVSVRFYYRTVKYDLDGLKQDCSNSVAKALEFLQFCSKPTVWHDVARRTKNIDIQRTATLLVYT